jgi:hypothetical protein
VLAVRFDTLKEGAAARVVARTNNANGSAPAASASAAPASAS